MRRRAGAATTDEMRSVRVEVTSKNPLPTFSTSLIKLESLTGISDTMLGGMSFQVLEKFPVSISELRVLLLRARALPPTAMPPSRFNLRIESLVIERGSFERLTEI